jgi:hypothetical protein
VVKNDLLVTRLLDGRVGLVMTALFVINLSVKVFYHPNGAQHFSAENEPAALPQAPV